MTLSGDLRSARPPTSCPPARPTLPMISPARCCRSQWRERRHGPGVRLVRRYAAGDCRQRRHCLASIAACPCRSPRPAHHADQWVKGKRVGGGLPALGQGPRITGTATSFGDRAATLTHITRAVRIHIGDQLRNVVCGCLSPSRRHPWHGIGPISPELPVKGRQRFLAPPYDEPFSCWRDHLKP